jgi:hypothetical protein
MAAANTETSRVYVGMLSLTAIAMLVGITVLVLEGMEYDWKQKPDTTPKVELPKDVPAAAATAPGALAPIIKPNVVVERTLPISETLSPVKTTAESPLVLPPILPPPVATAPAKPADTKPLTTPTAAPVGPVPSPLVLPRE